MGMFSWTCAKTHLPVLCGARFFQDYPDLCRVVVLGKDGSRLRGEYDGYGRVDGVDVVRIMDEGGKMVLASKYAGEPYDALGPSNRDRSQGGLLMPDETIEDWASRGGFGSHEEYLAAFAAIEDSRYGNIGDRWEVVVQRPGRSDYTLEMKVDEDLIQCGGSMRPGLVYEYPEEVDAVLGAVNSESVFLWMNEGYDGLEKRPDGSVAGSIGDDGDPDVGDEFRLSFVARRTKRPEVEKPKGG